MLAGQYVIDKVLGQGGFGITYQATDQKTGERVAVKEFFPDTMATRQDLVVMPFSGERGASYDYGKDRFLEEAQTLAQFLGNENTVHIHSYFEENGTAYFVMDFVEGTSFDVYIREHGGKLGWEETTKILIPIMDALGAVHSKGIVHRDVTPDNIFITKEGTVKLLDFGAARYSLGDKSRSLDVVLKHGFAPKEQYTRRGRQGPYTDVYALGATFYYALTGKRPPDSVERIDEDELIAPSSLGVKLPNAAEDAILTALNVQPAERFQSMEAFKRAMQGSENEPAAAGNGNGAQTAAAGAAAGAAAASAGNAAAAANNTAPAANNAMPQQPMQQPPQGQVQGQQPIAPSQMISPSVMMTPEQAAMYGAQMQASTPPKKKSNAGLVIGIIAAILLLAGGGVAAYFFLLGDGADDRRSARNESDRDDDDDDDDDDRRHSSRRDNDDDDDDDDNHGSDPGDTPVVPEPEPEPEPEVAEIKYTIFGANSGELLPDVEVELMDDYGNTVGVTTTGSDGRAVFSVEPGDYTIFCSADGYTTRAREFWAGTEGVDRNMALVPNVNGDDFIVLAEWEGKLDVDLCGFNEESQVATNYWNPQDSGDKGSGVHFGDHGSDKRFEMIYFHDYSYEAWRDIIVFDRSALDKGDTSSTMEAEGIIVSLYTADGMVFEIEANPARDELGWVPFLVSEGSYFTMNEENEAYIVDPNEYTWIY